MIKKRIKLPPGNYKYRITKPGYGTMVDEVEVIDRDIDINKLMTQDGYVLTIVPSPLDATVKIEINGYMVDGAEFTLSPGIYNYSVSKTGMSTSTGSVAIVDRNVIKNVTLEGVKYRLMILCEHDDATIEVEIDNVYVSGSIHRLVPGVYNYRVNKEGYDEVVGRATIVDKDIVVPVTFAGDKYKLTINTTPSDTKVEVQIGRDWVMGKVHDLTPGKYTYVISKKGFFDYIGTVFIDDKDVTISKTLEIDFKIDRILDKRFVDANMDPWYHRGTGAFLSDKGNIYGFFITYDQIYRDSWEPVPLKELYYTDRYTNLNNYAPFSEISCHPHGIFAIDRNKNVINIDGSDEKKRTITQADITAGSFVKIESEADRVTVGIKTDGSMVKIPQKDNHYVHDWRHWTPPTDKNYVDIRLSSGSYMALRKDGSVVLRDLKGEMEIIDRGPFASISYATLLGGYFAILKDNGKVKYFSDGRHADYYMGLPDDPNNVNIVSIGRDGSDDVFINNKGHVFEVSHTGTLRYDIWATKYIWDSLSVTVRAQSMWMRRSWSSDSISVYVDNNGKSYVRENEAGQFIKDHNITFNQFK